MIGTMRKMNKTGLHTFFNIFEPIYTPAPNANAFLNFFPVPLENDFFEIPLLDGLYPPPPNHVRPPDDDVDLLPDPDVDGLVPVGELPLDLLPLDVLPLDPFLFLGVGEPRTS
jgi:hypothetical protein